MHYHTKISAPSIEAFQNAFAMAMAKVIDNDTNEVIIFVQGKTNLDGIISDAIGGIATKLQKSGATKIGSVNVFLETEEIKSTFSSGVIIASHVSNKLLGKILADPRATDTVYVPWASEELDDYLKNNQSTEI